MLHRTAHAGRDHNRHPRCPSPAQTQQADAKTGSRASLGWTLVLRRQPTRIVDGRPQGYSDAFEIICCDCGDDPDLDYPHVPPGLQQIRGPYPIAAGIAAYEQHARHHHWQEAQARRIVGDR